MSNYLLMNVDEFISILDTRLNKALSRANQTVSTPVNKVLTLKEAAEYCKIPVPTFRQYLGSNLIKGSKIGKTWRFYKNDLDGFIQSYQCKTKEDIDKEIDNLLSNRK